MKILLAVDGSKGALHAVDFLIRHADWYRDKPTVELVTVHLPVPKLPHMGIVVSNADIERYYKEEGEALLAAAKKKLDAAGIDYRVRIRVGGVAEELVQHAVDEGCELILIGSRGMTALGAALLGSTATKVLHLSSLPVLLVK
jgi:nucleotide-binding universal stress UspA family protein